VDVSGGEGCRTITKGSRTVTDASPPGDLFSGTFNVSGGQGVILNLSAGQNVGFSNNGFDCGGAFYNELSSFYSWGSVYSWNDNVVAPRDYSGCNAYVNAYSGGFGGGEVSWSTEVCDPGAF
jgi:hypothetical protein